MERTYYKKTQTGILIIVTFFIALLILIIFRAALPPSLLPIFIITVAFIVILFYSLTIKVTDKKLIIYFGPGLIKFSFEISKITSCTPLENPITYGWGIKKIPGGWLFNVTGLKVFEITLNNGKVYRIGSPEPEKVCEIIRRIQSGSI